MGRSPIPDGVMGTESREGSGALDLASLRRGSATVRVLADEQHMYCRLLQQEIWIYRDWPMVPVGAQRVDKAAEQPLDATDVAQALGIPLKRCGCWPQLLSRVGLLEQAVEGYTPSATARAVIEACR